MLLYPSRINVLERGPPSAPTSCVHPPARFYARHDDVGGAPDPNSEKKMEMAMQRDCMGNAGPTFGGGGGSVDPMGAALPPTFLFSP